MGTERVPVSIVWMGLFPRSLVWPAAAGKYLCRIYGQLPVLDVLLVSGIGLWIFLFQSPAVYADAVHRLP